VSEWEILIPRPRSKFLKVKCGSCESEQEVFSHSKTKIYCKSCGALLVEPTGGKAKISGKIVAVLG
jgi:small subunit ribosomal protein S27e